MDPADGLVEEIVVVRGIQRVELILRAHAAIERFAVTPELDVGQTCRDAAIPVGVEGVEVYRSADETPRVNGKRIGDGYALAIYDARLLLTGRVDEVGEVIFAGMNYLY